MRAWLITTGEPLPGERGARLWRTGLLARVLSEEGHDVVWWTSSFDHFGKRQRSAADALIEAGPRYQIRLVRTPGYGSNVSVRRIVDHAVMARRFAAAASRESPPDVILCSLPTLDLCVAATAYGKRRGVPVIVDVRDLWPDVLVELMPRVLRPIGRVAVSPMRLQAKAACSRAAALTGVTQSFIGWALQLAGRPATALDRAFPMGYPSQAPDPAAVAQAEEFWTRLGIAPDSGAFTVCFLGTLGRQFEIGPVIEAARRLERAGRRFRFVICGTGERLAHYQRMAQGCAVVLLPGWVDAAALWVLMRRSSVGIAPYVRSPNFLLNIPNKPIEYFSAGLPVLTNLQGELAGLLQEHDCGMTYEGQNVDSLVAALSEMAASPARVRQLAQNARQLYDSTFTSDRVYRDMAAHLDRVARTRSRV